MAAYAISTALVLPSTILNLAGGSLFEVFWGILWTSLAAVGSAIITFWITRLWIRWYFISFCCSTFTCDSLWSCQLFIWAYIRNLSRLFDQYCTGHRHWPIPVCNAGQFRCQSYYSWAGLAYSSSHDSRWITCD